MIINQTDPRPRETRSKDDQLVANSPDGFGAVDLRTDPSGRLQRLLSVLVPIYKGQGLRIPDGLTPAELATNDYLDRCRTLPAT
jgi:hypothetical protein